MRLHIVTLVILHETYQSNKFCHVIFTPCKCLSQLFNHNQSITTILPYHTPNMHTSDMHASDIPHHNSTNNQMCGKLYVNMFSVLCRHGFLTLCFFFEDVHQACVLHCNLYPTLEQYRCILKHHQTFLDQLMQRLCQHMPKGFLN